jgi:hypothetical protein
MKPADLSLGALMRLIHWTILGHARQNFAVGAARRGDRARAAGDLIRRLPARAGEAFGVGAVAAVNASDHVAGRFAAPSR